MKAENARCRSCNQQGIEIFLDLGLKPPSDRIMTKEMMNQPEPFLFYTDYRFLLTLALIFYFVYILLKGYSWWGEV